jgi:hypothetical protein
MIAIWTGGIQLVINLEAARLKVIAIHHLVWDFEQLGVGGAMIKSPKIFYCPFGFFSLGIPRYIHQ